MASLHKRKNSKGETIWVIRYRIGKKEKFKTIGKTDKRTAQQVLMRFEADLAKNRFKIEEIKNISLKTFNQEYLKFSRAEKAETTFEREKIVLNKFYDYFGDVNLNIFTTKDIEEYRVNRLKQVSEETVNLEIRHLKSVFNRACSFKYILENPFLAIKPIRVPESDLPRFFELEEIEKIRKFFSGDAFQELIDFYLLTGVRRNEALKLTRDDVDFRRKILFIRSTYTKGKKHRIISFNGDKQLRFLLENLPEREDNLMFGPRNGAAQWKPRWVTRRISANLAEIGFPWASCHTFRHTFISHLIMSGVPLLTVKELVGHADIQTTLRYAHLAPLHKKEMLNKRPY